MSAKLGHAEVSVSLSQSWNGLQTEFPNEISKRKFQTEFLNEISKRNFQTKFPNEISIRNFQTKFPYEISKRNFQTKFPNENCKRNFQTKISKQNFQTKLPKWKFPNEISKQNFQTKILTYGLDISFWNFIEKFFWKLGIENLSQLRDSDTLNSVCPILLTYFLNCLKIV